MATTTDRARRRAPTRAARVRTLSAIFAPPRPRRRAASRATLAAPLTTPRPDGRAEAAAAAELGAQMAAIQDAIAALSQQLRHASSVDQMDMILDQQDRLQKAHRDLMAKKIMDQFIDSRVQGALDRLKQITGDLAGEAKLLKQATNLVNRVSKVLGFVSEGLGLLAKVGLIAA